MSLTGFLSNKKDKSCLKFQEVIKIVTPSKNDFQAFKSETKAFDTKIALKVKYNLNNNIEAVVVGTAFDYLARFRIAQVVKKNNMKVMENLVAENFFDRFKGRLSRRSYNKLIDEYNYAIENIKRYIELNIPFDKEIIEKTCILAKLEACWRDGKLPNDLKYLFNKPSREIMNELIGLIDLFELEFIKKVVKSNSIVIYNPNFGLTSYSIGGADADIYIDGTIYDFKTSKNIGYKGKDVQQVIGYYILNEVEKKRHGEMFNNSIGNKIVDKIAIYLARVGEIYYFDVNNIDSEVINNVVSEVEKILFKNINNVFGRERKSKLNKEIFVMCILVSLFIVGVLGYKIGQEIKENKNFVESSESYNSNEVSEENKNEQANKVDEHKEITEEYDDKKENDKQTYKESYDIENDYLEKEKSIREVLTKGQGFFRYYSTLIETLRSYDVTNINNAKVVYKLSDELLNNMYQSFKESWSTEAFDELTSRQLIWIDRKMEIEEELKNDDLLRYQTLIEVTLDKCEEWTEYYK
ncbi:MAG: hypothetical protein E7D69_13795 [Clostridium celatum]|nr:hypothetical protein [Clostridium celatum]